MPDGSPIPLDMFTFTEEELTLAPEVVETLIPPHVKVRIAEAAAAAPAAPAAAPEAPAAPTEEVTA